MERLMVLLGGVMLTTMTAIGCSSHLQPHNLPPAERLMHPGPGVDGPGPGVLMRGELPSGEAGMAMGGCGMQTATSQLAFIRPDGMTIRWEISQTGMFDSEPLVVPGRQNFPQGAIYRLKLTDIPGREGLELYPTIEVGMVTPRTDAFLAHSPIPIEFTEEDFDQVQSGNYVTKVIYLPDPEFQELALAGVETLVSTRLDPGVDPIVEADRRGSILAILRVGNKDLELPGVEGGVEGSVLPASYAPPAAGVVPYDGAGYGEAGAMGGPVGPPTAGFAPSPMPPGYVSGVNGPEWGMPMTGTPIGLPGPPHVPLGGPAGLQKHVVRNHTFQHMPNPTRKVRIDVKQKPGFTYPKPPSHAWVRESVRAPVKGFPIPWGNSREVVQ